MGWRGGGGSGGWCEECEGERIEGVKNESEGVEMEMQGESVGGQRIRMAWDRKENGGWCEGCVGGWCGGGRMVREVHGESEGKYEQMFTFVHKLFTFGVDKTY